MNFRSLRSGTNVCSCVQQGSHEKFCQIILKSGKIHMADDHICKIFTDIISLYTSKLLICLCKAKISYMQKYYWRYI